MRADYEKKGHKGIDWYPEYDDTLPDWNDFYDSSEKNDSCPSIAKDLDENTELRVYCDYKDPLMSDCYSEEYEYERYHLKISNDLTGWEAFLCHTNDLAKIRAIIDQFTTSYKGE